MKKIPFLLVLLVVSLVLFETVKAQEVDSDSSRLKMLDDKLNTTIKQISNYDSTIKNLSDEYSGLKKRLEEANRKYKNGQIKYDQIVKKIDSLERQRILLENQVQLKFSENRKFDSAITEKASIISVLTNRQNELVLQNESSQKQLDSTKEQNKKDSANLTKIRTAVDSVKNLLESIKDTLVVIAEVHLAKQPIPIYIDDSANHNQTSTKKNTNIAATNTSFRIEKIRMRIKEGIILNIYVFDSAGNIYRNKKSPISLSSINEERKFDKLYADPYGNSSQIEWRYVRLSDVLRYIPRRSYSYFPYVDVEIDLSQKDSIYYIRENTSVNAYVNVAVFSDINGISGGANGLAQIDLAGKFITQTKNVRNTALILFNYFSAHGYVGKFDNQFKGADLLSGDSVSRIDLMQRSYFSIGVRQNLMHWVLSPMPRRLIEDITIDIGYNFNGARVRNIFDKDTVANSKTMDTTYRVVTQNQLFIEPKMTFTRNSNFGCSISTAFIYQGVKKSSQLANTEMRFYFHPAINFYYHSKKEPDNKIFLRYTHMVDMKTPKDAFFQLQLGYSASVTKLLSM